MIPMAVTVAVSMTVIMIVMVVLWLLAATDSCLFFELLYATSVQRPRITTSSLQASMRQ